MKLISSLTFALLALHLVFTAPVRAQQSLKIAPVHRYSFSNTGGSLTDGTQILDLVGTAHGTVRGAGATASGTVVRLPGGSPASAAYIDLPNGVASGSGQIFPGYTNVTYELWATIHSSQNWSRLLDFGRNSAGETTAPGGSFSGTDYLFVSTNIGGANDVRFERGGINLTGSGTQDALAATTLGTPVHIVVSYDNASAAWKLYKNGALLRTVATLLGPSSVNDLNVWLGRSNWSGDNNADVSFDEMRIYDYALNDQQVTGNYQSGPDTLNVVSADTIAPVFGSNPITGANGLTAVPYNGTIAGSATDGTPGDALTYSKIAGPAWLIVSASGALSGTPSSTGLNSFTIRATDAAGNYSNATLNIDVANSQLPSGWSQSDIGAVGVAGSATYNSGSGTYTVSGSGAGIWDTADAFQFVHQTLTGNGEIRVRVTSQTNSDSWAKAGVMIRDGTSPGAVNAFVAITPSNGFTFQSRSTTSGSSTSITGPALNPASNNWVRLTRCGSLFTAYVSANGTSWTQIGTATLTMGSSVSAGLAVTSHNNTVLGTATFDNVAVTPFPAPWLTADIGSTGLAGNAEYYGNAYTVKGAGIFGGSADGFRYVYQTLSADGSIVARVSTLNNTGTSARVGIMIRDTLANNSRMAALSVTGAGAFKWERRTTAGSTVSNTNSSSGTAPNIWVRLMRSGNTITASKSTNGTAWTTIGNATVTMGSNCYIGLSVASGSSTTLNTSVMDNVTAVP